ncbi:hypothetical protein ACFX2G_035208 [Malus domestica]
MEEMCSEAGDCYLRSRSHSSHCSKIEKMSERTREYMKCAHAEACEALVAALQESGDDGAAEAAGITFSSLCTHARKTLVESMLKS